MKQEEITITLKEYEQLKQAAQFLRCLEAAGVDNWEGYDYAVELIDEQESDEEEE
jgi:hypothetical protein